MAKILILRFSSLGDVAMSVPVIHSVAEKYPQDEFYVVTKAQFVGVFAYWPKNVTVFPVDTQKEYRGFLGLIRMIWELVRMKPDKVADLHQVIRSVVISGCFFLMGKKVRIINKGRFEKSTLTQKKNKRPAPIRTTIERYRDVFTELGYDFDLNFRNIFDYADDPRIRQFDLISKGKVGTWIGIAPFAKQKGKTYPLEKMEEVIAALSARKHVTMFLFGGKEEQPILKDWEKRYPGVTTMDAGLEFVFELALIQSLNVMLTMDSGNMHLASLVNTPVVSIWGPTHPKTGFYGFGQDPRNAVQVDLPCRPCSIYGNKPCYRKDYACMNAIEPWMILDQIDVAIQKKARGL